MTGPKGEQLVGEDDLPERDASDQRFFLAMDTVREAHEQLDQDTREIMGIDSWGGWEIEIIHGGDVIYSAEVPWLLKEAGYDA